MLDALSSPTSGKPRRADMEFLAASWYEHTMTSPRDLARNSLYENITVGVEGLKHMVRVKEAHIVKIRTPKGQGGPDT